MSCYDLYSPVADVDAKDDEHGTVRNCFVHMLTESNIYIDKFKRLIETGAVGGDISWGIQKWDIDSEEDHEIKSYFEGYLFFIGESEHCRIGQGESQIITIGLNSDNQLVIRQTFF